MRLITRGDLDGLTGAVILSCKERIDDVMLVHPQDIADRRVRVTSDDVLVNLPYHPDCAMWFDHHLLTEASQDPPDNFAGRYGIAASAARLVYQFYLEKDPSLVRFETLVDETDRLDSANLTSEDISDPKDYILLGYTIDNRSGLGADFRGYFMLLLDALKTRSIAEVMELPEVKERVARLQAEEQEFRKLLLEKSRMEKNVVVTDLRDVESMPAGNRFLIYALFPDANVSLRIHWGPQRQSIIAAVGHSILNRTCRISVGDLMAAYGGGGHRGAGTCKIPVAEAERSLDEILKTLSAGG